jgi:hypothetical protein
MRHSNRIEAGLSSRAIEGLPTPTVKAKEAHASAVAKKRFTLSPFPIPLS